MQSSEFDFDVVTGPSTPRKPTPAPAQQPAPQRPR
jgi:hypothetical protein